jgi:hypothetical protein
MGSHTGSNLGHGKQEVDHGANNRDSEGILVTRPGLIAGISRRRRIQVVMVVIVSHGWALCRILNQQAPAVMNQSRTINAG